MKFPWLEELVKEGTISARMRDEIMSDCYEIVKVAIDVNSAEYKKVMEVAQPFIRASSLLLAGGALMGASKVRDWAEIRSTIKDIAKNKGELLSTPDFKDHADVASARFDEVAQLAPTVARNKPFMTRLLKTRLHSGLTEQDVATLSSLQATYTPRMGIQKRMQEKSAEVRAGMDTGSRAADLYLITKYAASKPLDWGLVGDAVLKGLGIAAGLGAVSAVTGGISHAIGVKNQKDLQRRQAEAFQRAVDMSSEDEPLKKNLDKARDAFKSLVHFAPHVAADPQAARSFMTKVVAYDRGIEASSIKDLADIERSLYQARGPSAFAVGAATGAKYLGTERIMSKTMEHELMPLEHQITHEMAGGLGVDLSKVRPYTKNMRGAWGREKR